MSENFSRGLVRTEAKQYIRWRRREDNLTNCPVSSGLTQGSGACTSTALRTFKAQDRRGGTGCFHGLTDGAAHSPTSGCSAACSHPCAAPPHTRLLPRGWGGGGSDETCALRSFPHLGRYTTPPCRVASVPPRRPSTPPQAGVQSPGTRRCSSCLLKCLSGRTHEPQVRTEMPYELQLKLSPSRTTC